ncbi:uncharacterized protein LOC126672675 [Mercurialis annua]|uniref:uncharacterized protein LOC126672675 n=1 Tax=Mercurialis annua TaxID=3986 RepID=UPI0021603845|nr:uncharacterized protein LOC126672675 [Mercurialis annua]
MVILFSGLVSPSLGEETKPEGPVGREGTAGSVGTEGIVGINGNGGNLGRGNRRGNGNGNGVKFGKNGLPDGKLGFAAHNDGAVVEEGSVAAGGRGGDVSDGGNGGNIDENEGFSGVKSGAGKVALSSEGLGSSSRRSNLLEAKHEFVLQRNNKANKVIKRLKMSVEAMILD